MLRPEQLTAYGPALPRRAVVSATLIRLDAGRLILRSGVLAFGNLGTPDGCDPDWVPRVPAPNGSHPVDVSLYRWQGGIGPEDEGGDVTAVRIVFSDAEVARWEKLSDEHGPDRLDVDHGIAAMFDHGDADIANKLAGIEGLDILASLWEYKQTPWFMWHQGVIAFRCGLGDGMYDIWLGSDSQDQLASVVLDLELLPEPSDSKRNGA